MAEKREGQGGLPVCPRCEAEEEGVHYTRRFVSRYGNLKAKVRGCGARDSASCSDGEPLSRGGKNGTEGVLGKKTTYLRKECCKEQGICQELTSATK